MNLEWFKKHSLHLEPLVKTLLYGAVRYINLV
jgi:hypothetical protein